MYEDNENDQFSDCIHIRANEDEIICTNCFSDMYLYGVFCGKSNDPQKEYYECQNCGKIIEHKEIRKF